jgi:hypothetical protein
MAKFMGELIELPAQSIEPGNATLAVSLELPKGYKLNSVAPTSIKAVSAEQRIVGFSNGAEAVVRNPQFPVSIPVKVKDGETKVTVDFAIYYCESGKESLCFIKEARLVIPVKAQKGARNNRLTADYKLALPGQI